MKIYWHHPKRMKFFLFLAGLLILSIVTYMYWSSKSSEYPNNNGGSTNMVANHEVFNLPHHGKGGWAAIDSRAIPGWYDEAKFGIFIHWGVFSVPSVIDEWFWYRWKTEKKEEALDIMKNGYKDGFTYSEFAPKFTAEFFDPHAWAELFEASGAKYVVLTSKHHEGYTLWPSKFSWNWNSNDVGPHRDLVGDLSSAIRARGKDIKFGIYYSLYEWFNPLYLSDKHNDYKTQHYIQHKMMPELIDVVMKYKPEVVWADGSWDTTHTYWNSTQFITWLYNDSPVKDTVVTNDRWGQDVRCKNGGFLTCKDRYHPTSMQSRKWENCMTIDKKSWGYRRNAKLEDYYTLKELVELLVSTVSYGGNLLMNVGPGHDGVISPLYEERLRGMGDWLKINGEAIYGSRPWKVQRDALTDKLWYTVSGDGRHIYGIFTAWPRDGILHLSGVGADDRASGGEVTLLGHLGALDRSSVKTSLHGLRVHLGDNPSIGHHLLLQPAWAVRINTKL